MDMRGNTPQAFMNALAAMGVTGPGADVWLRECAVADSIIRPIDHVFNYLAGAYPIRWNSAFGSAESIENWCQVWGRALGEDGITPEEVARGLRACRQQYDWPPSLTEFLSACRPQLNIDAALYEGIEQTVRRARGEDTWSHPAIYWAAVKVGERDMMSQSFAQLRPRFDAALKAVLAGALMPVPARRSAIAAPGKAESSREHAQCRLAELGATDALRTLRVQAGCCVQWAFELLARGKGKGGQPLTAEIRRHAEEVVRSRAGRVFMMTAPEDVRERYALMVGELISTERGIEDHVAV